MRLSPALRRKIQRALSLDSNPEADVDELNAVLLQIALALMLVFMIVVFLFIQNTGGEISRLSFGMDDQKAVIRCIEEDGRSSLTFGYGGWITARCPSGVYAGKAVSMDESHFCGLLMNLDGVSRTEIRLAKTDGGLLLETKPESDSDEEFSLLFADAEGIA